MYDYKQTRLWKETLGVIDDPMGKFQPHEFLRTIYFTFRERAISLSEEIARDLPDFPAHDVSHSDALWFMADLIIGSSERSINPMEAFLLGCSFLVHDLGMCLASYPEGISQLKKRPDWKDSVVALQMETLKRIPTDDEINNPNSEVIKKVTDKLLRKLHAERAEFLCINPWKSKENYYYLIEDQELRNKYGRIIGKIAQSHSWPVSRLIDEFVTEIGAHPRFPRDWVIDPLKLACLLRAADASHIDASRASGFLRTIRKPSKTSVDYWKFQEHLQQPRLEVDRLVYTSAYPFSIQEAESWWICIDTLRMIDKELRQIDAVLADCDRNRFAARGVAGIDDVSRIAKFVSTDGWLPVDTQIKVGNIPKLIEKLGGEQLYGQNPMVPLRELIQNGSDAIRARRFLDKRPSDWGDIIIRKGKDSEGDWIEVEDNGVGMSHEVLTGPFLDFGNSFWSSDLVISEYPGLLSNGFRSTGKYGIGFFSVFMWGDHVRVTTCRYDAARNDTQILEFNDGLSSRPLLRRADFSEIVRDGGTRVRVWLDKNRKDKWMLNYGQKDLVKDLEKTCIYLCPSIDVNIYIETNGYGKKLIIRSSDWIDIKDEELLKRIWIFVDEHEGEKDNFIKSLDGNLRSVRDSSGNVVLRACISYGRAYLKEKYFLDFKGTVTVGGLRSSGLYGILGILTGNAISASRDSAIPLVDKNELAKWSSEQADLIPNSVNEPEEQAVCAETIAVCGGRTGSLPIAHGSSGWLNYSQIVERFRSAREIVLISEPAYYMEKMKFKEFKLNDNVIAVSMGIPGILQTHSAYRLLLDWPDRGCEAGHHVMKFHCKTLMGVVINALAMAWSSPLDAILDISEFDEDDKELIQEVGLGDGEPVRLESDLIRRPNSKKVR